MGSNNTTRRSQNDIQEFLDKEKEKFLERFEHPVRQNAQLEDFELIRTIGTGSFGKYNLFFNGEKKNKTIIKYMYPFAFFYRFFSRSSTVS